MPSSPAEEVGMSVKDANRALMDFLGIDPDSSVIKIEVTAIPEQFPMVMVTKLLTDRTWKTESRMFELVPYKRSL
jgi:DNA-binding GntR family transcriptional regulator